MCQDESEYCQHMASAHAYLRGPEGRARIGSRRVDEEFLRTNILRELVITRIKGGPSPGLNSLARVPRCLRK